MKKIKDFYDFFISTQSIEPNQAIINEIIFLRIGGIFWTAIYVIMIQAVNMGQSLIALTVLNSILTIYGIFIAERTCRRGVKSILPRFGNYLASKYSSAFLFL